MFRGHIRSRTGETKPQRIVKRRSNPKDGVKHSEVGKEIYLETYVGKKKYILYIRRRIKRMIAVTL